jgi:hypothetical protein
MLLSNRRNTARVILTDEICEIIRHHVNNGFHALLPLSGTVTTADGREIEAICAFASIRPYVSRKNGGGRVARIAYPSALIVLANGGLYYSYAFTYNDDGTFTAGDKEDKCES